MSSRESGLISYNPWRLLPDRAPYILSDDRGAVEQYNQSVHGSHQVNLELPPDPYIGNPFKARVLVLTKNPAWDDHLRYDVDRHPDLIDRMKANLLFKNEDWPFYYLDPAFADTEGHKWWHAALRELIEACDEINGGKGLEAVAKYVMTVAYFPYRSEGYTGKVSGMRSQLFSHETVRFMMEHEDLKIIIMSHEKEWMAEIRRLKDRAQHTRNPQARFVSRKNLPDGLFDEIVKTLVKPE